MDKETLKLAAATIREEMVCCDMRDQVSRAYREGGVVAVRALKRTSDYHAICNYGEMAARYVEELLDEDDPQPVDDVTKSPVFKLGFKIAARLKEAAFRDRLSDAGGGEEHTALLVAVATEPLSEVLARMEHYERGLILVEDETEPQGVRLVWWEKR